MKLKIRCNYKAHKLQITSDAYQIRLVMLIFDTFKRPKNSRFFFLMGLSFLLVLLLAPAKPPVRYEQITLVVMTATVILGCTICKLGPPAQTA